MSAPPEEIATPITAGGAEGGSKEAMDELLRTCFLSALKRSLKDKDLPILLNLFFANHLLAVKPKDETLDMKKTSYKKVLRGTFS
jgi:translation initiation factor 2D